jgi:enediyne biosynthesis protein E4
VKRIKTYITLVIIFLLFNSCNNSKLFSLESDSSGVIFENKLEYTEEFNPYTYRNFYNGGGVALGDINNDGLIDIYLTGNIVDNKMFLNKGAFQFEDITKASGLECPNVWSTGATFADINGDGLLDLYICKSGAPGGENRHNELFINNGDLTFSEESKKYNLDILGLSVHAAFFDYDKDGDLDCYILNNSIRSIGGYDLIKDQREIADPEGQGNKLLENRDGKFVDVTQSAGIYSSKIGFGLGITLSDYNNDGWTDLFISNDFFEKDYLYINNQDGTFSEESENFFQSLSLGSMGADSSDLDNDLLTDLIVTEMLPKSLKRKKTKAIYESWDKYSLANSKGYYHQFPRNVLQRNYGPSGFLEIGRYSGVSATDWSWASMIFDMDNDGLRDVFIANGIYKDLLDRDYLAYMANTERIRNMIKKEEEVIKKLIDIMPSKAIKNIAYKNNGEFNFTDFSDPWGFDLPTFSNGMSYGDLDNDGDLDIVINNVNMPALVYKNNSNIDENKSISFELIGKEKNKNAVGSKIIIKYANNKQSMIENFPSRGFQSSIPNRLHFGVGNVKEIDSAIIYWPNNKVSYHTNLETNKTHKIKQEESKYEYFDIANYSDLNLKLNEIELFNFKHNENKFIDFNKERLLTQMYSNEGPALASGDINNDGVIDFFIGGAKGESSAIFVSIDNQYEKIIDPFSKKSATEDVIAEFFDSDNDGDLDLYVGSGGKAFSMYNQNLNDRLYINDGKGKFVLSTNSFEFENPISTGAVAIDDYNNDGLLDLFIGERFNPDLYGIPVSGHLFENKGGNKFVKVEQKALKELGLIKSASWTNLNNDKFPDLIVAGEWMPIKIFINKNGVLKDYTKEFGLSNSNGMWNKINIIDIDKDGDMDILAGNLGTNNFFSPNMKLYINDFDKNGFYEQILCEKIGNSYFPILDKDDLINQMPSLKKQLFYYKDYSDASIDKIFSPDLLNKSTVLDIKTLESAIYINNNGKFNKISLPSEINYSPVFDIINYQPSDKNITKLIFGGNQYLVKPQFGRHDSSKGWIIDVKKDQDELIFTNLKSLNIEGQIRKFELISLGKEKILITGINNKAVKFYEIK